MDGLTSALNEYEYVLLNAPDEASRRLARSHVEEAFDEVRAALRVALDQLSVAEGTIEIMRLRGFTVKGSEV